PLDIDDRIGGTLQILGTAQNSVVFTSLFDDTIGAGFNLTGQVMLDTNGDATTTIPQPGDWQSIRLDRYSNDRNVAVINEVEPVRASPISNDTTAIAQPLGNLAPDLPGDTPESHQGGNDEQVLGFEVHGVLKSPTDVDVYSFNGIAGTEVWL